MQCLWQILRFKERAKGPYRQESQDNKFKDSSRNNYAALSPSKESTNYDKKNDRAKRRVDQMS